MEKLIPDSVNVNAGVDLGNHGTGIQLEKPINKQEPISITTYTEYKNVTASTNEICVNTSLNIHPVVSINTSLCNEKNGSKNFCVGGGIRAKVLNASCNANLEACWSIEDKNKKISKKEEHTPYTKSNSAENDWYETVQEMKASQKRSEALDKEMEKRNLEFKAQLDSSVNKKKEGLEFEPLKNSEPGKFLRKFLNLYIEKNILQIKLRQRFKQNTDVFEEKEGCQ